VRILHTSDLHGQWRLPMRFEDFDVWVDTGDFLPNLSRGKAVEAGFQRSWLTKGKLKLRKRTLPWLESRYEKEGSKWYPKSWYPKGTREPPRTGSIVAELAAWLRGRPMISVQGNHDFTSLVALLRRAGARAWDVADGPIELGGEVFAGFREISFVAGEWAGEMGRGILGDMEGRQLVARTMRADPTVLLTHSPGLGVFDFAPPKGGHCGIPALSTYLQRRPNRVKAHLFGHVHEEPNVGLMGGIVYSNAATTARILQLPGSQ
jgi:Icc-related predicted phosphoesterase